MDKPDRPDDKPRLPEVEHVRLDIPGDPAKGIPRIIIEERGLRSFARREHTNNLTTLTAAALNSSDPSAVFQDLFDEANCVLTKAGEQTLADVLARVDEIRSAPEFSALPEPQVTLLVTEHWRDSIGQRHGHLSPQATAASFLVMTDRIRELIGSDEKAMITLSEFCEVWHWHHMEVTGEHALAANTGVREIPIIPEGFAPAGEIRSLAENG